MHIEYFLKLRTGFIRYFYENAVSRFIEIKTAIEKQEEPFVPPYREDEESAFLDEWIEAETGINAVGYACMSMVSSSLHLFLREWVARWEREHGVTCRLDSREGWFNGYQAILKNLGFSLSGSGADLGIIEQTILGRNRAQHPEELATLRVTHCKKDMKRFPNPFFASEAELRMVGSTDCGDAPLWLMPSVAPTRDKLFEAINQVEVLCTWLEAQCSMARDE